MRRKHAKRKEEEGLKGSDAENVLSQYNTRGKRRETAGGVIVGYRRLTERKHGERGDSIVV